MKKQGASIGGATKHGVSKGGAAKQGAPQGGAKKSIPQTEIHEGGTEAKKRPTLEPGRRPP